MHLSARTTAELRHTLREALHHQERFDPLTSERTFTLAMTDIGEIVFLPELIARVKREAPGIALSTVRNTATNLRDELESPSGGAPQAMLGAVYVSCAGRGGPHFGSPSAELQLVRRALGDVPLVGFFAGGEIAADHVYGYTGVLTVFTE